MPDNISFLPRDRKTYKQYLTNSNGSYKLDKLGRRRHVNQSGKGTHKSGRPKSSFYTKQINLRLDEEMYNAIIAIPLGKRAHNLRAWIEWGLENDK